MFKKLLILFVMIFMCVNVCAQQDTIFIKILRTDKNEIFSDIVKFTKKYNKDFTIINVCEADKVVSFLLISGRYSAYAILVTLELEYVESQFDIIKREDLSIKCKGLQ